MANSKQYFTNQETLQILRMLEGDKGDATLAIEILSGVKTIKTDTARFIKTFNKGKATALAVQRSNSNITTTFNPVNQQDDELKQTHDIILQLEKRYDFKRLQAKIKRKYS